VKSTLTEEEFSIIGYKPKHIVHIHSKENVVIWKYFNSNTAKYQRILDQLNHRKSVSGLRSTSITVIKY
jgi:hypothetical protein